MSTNKMFRQTFNGASLSDENWNATRSKERDKKFTELNGVDEGDA